MSDIDPASITWDAAGPTIDPSSVRWEEPSSKEKARSVIASFMAGTGAGFGKSVLGLQQFAGKALSTVGADKAGSWLTKDANEGIANLNAQNQPYADAHPTANFAGDITGAVANPINFVVPMGGIAKGAGIIEAAPGLFARGATQGVISGAAAPVDNDENFGWHKAGQMLAGGLAGGVMAPVANGLIQGAGDLTMRAVGAVRGASVDAVEQAIRQAAQTHGVDLSQIPDAAMAQVRKDVAAALGKGKTLDPAAAIRKAEGDLVLGDAGLTTGQATRDPRLISTEQNSRGLMGGEEIQKRFNAQGGALLNALDKTASGTTKNSAYATADELGNALRTADKTRQAGVKGLYNQADAFHAGEIPLDSAGFANAADAALNPPKGISVTAFLPEQFKGILNDISSGKTPLTVSVAEQLRTMLATATRGTSDGTVKTALGHVREALDNAQPAVQLGEDATNAFNTARAAHKARMTAIDETPALAAAVDGTEPDKFFQKFVINGNARDLQKMVKTLATEPNGNVLRIAGPGGDVPAIPTVVTDVRQQIINHLKSAALGTNREEDGHFSSSAFKTALGNLGDERLGVFFSPKEIADLHRIERVADYTQKFPRASTVNTSNTGAVVANTLNEIGKQVPVLGWLYKGLKAGSDTLTVGNALAGKIPTKGAEGPINALRALTYPAGAVSGALAADQLK